MSDISENNTEMVIDGGNTTPPLSSVWNYHYEPNQMHPELANLMSMSPFDGTVSSSRKQMFGASHISQCLVIDKSTPRRIQTGAEIQYGHATFATKVDRQCKVLHMIPFYNTKLMGADAIRHNPETLLIVEYEDNGEIDSISMKEFFSNHQHFGFRYKNTEAARWLRGGVDGSVLEAGTILQDSPSKRPDGNYCYGINLNVMFASYPEVAEDGILISDEAVPWLKIRKYEKRTVPFGSTHFPLNIYGDDEVYKPFPEIGDYIRSDGLIMALRSYSNDYSAVEMCASACRDINYPFDKTIYAPSGHGKVIDVRVSHDISRPLYSPNICNDQALKYDRAARLFYAEVYKHYETMRINKGKRLKISHNFKNLVKHAYAVIQEGPNGAGEQRVQKLYRASPMDDFTVEFVIEYEAIPKDGYKLTDTVGGKGVIVKVVPVGDMPVDEKGNRAHVVMDAGATVSRQNIGRLYEQFFNACSRDLVKEFCDLFGVKYPGTHGQKLSLAEKMKVEAAYKSKDTAAEAAWARFSRYIDIISPVQSEFYQAERNAGRHVEHVISLLEDGIYIYHPCNNDPELPDVIEALKNEFMPYIGNVTYRGNSGRMVTTKEKILIGEIYFILLEKTGDDWSSVSSSKLQNFGIISHINNQDKHSSPWRQQAIRAWGETETAIAVAYMGPRIMAEIMDRNNSIASHRSGVYNILRSDTPTNIPVLIDRNKIPLGSAKPLELVKHLGFCNGWQFTYRPYQEMEPRPTAINFVA